MSEIGVDTLNMYRLLHERGVQLFQHRLGTDFMSVMKIVPLRGTFKIETIVGTNSKQMLSYICIKKIQLVNKQTRIRP